MAGALHSVNNALHIDACRDQHPIADHDWEGR
jgi:hypothetical protein